VDQALPEAFRDTMSVPDDHLSADEATSLILYLRQIISGPGAAAQSRDERKADCVQPVEAFRDTMSFLMTTQCLSED
jgi:hypothetical protein